MIAIFFFVRHSLDCSLMHLVRLPKQNSGCSPGYNVNNVLTVMLCITNAYLVINVKQELSCYKIQQSLLSS